MIRQIRIVCTIRVSPRAKGWLTRVNKIDIVMMVVIRRVSRVISENSSSQNFSLGCR